MKKHKLIQVKVIKLRGETGLLLPGTLHFVAKKTADVWVKKGWIELVEKPKPKAKQKKSK